MRSRLMNPATKLPFDWQRCKITVVQLRDKSAWIGTLWDWENQIVFYTSAATELAAWESVHRQVRQTNLFAKTLDLSPMGTKHLCEWVINLPHLKQVCTALELQVKKTGYGDEYRVAWRNTLHSELSASYQNGIQDAVGTAIAMWKHKHGIQQ